MNTFDNLKNKNLTLLFGGSFNPPTIAHKKIIDYLASLPNVGQLIVLPNGDDYHFNDKKMVSFNHRKAMVELCCQGCNNVIVSDYENQNHFKGIKTTLELFNHPYFVMGSDCLKTINQWIDVEELIKNNQFIVFKRSNDDIDNIINNNELLKNNINHFYKLDLIIDDVSSTGFRNDHNQSIVISEVYDYIVNNNLY